MLDISKGSVLSVVILSLKDIGFTPKRGNKLKISLLVLQWVHYQTQINTQIESIFNQQILY